jgi:putative endonuclease
MQCYVYILESLADGKWYYGFSENIDQRFDDHQTNRAKYTRFKGPWKLIFKREFSNKSEALQFEKYFTEVNELYRFCLISLKNRAQLKGLKNGLVLGENLSTG